MKKDIRKSTRRLPEETIGIDLGDKMSHYAILNAEGTVVDEGTFRNHAESIRLHFSGKPARIALEVGSQSAWISRELKQLGHEVIVANARQVKWITAGDNKHDRVDAQKLALLARVDKKMLAPIEHRSAEQQADLSAIRSRDALVRARTLLVNAARGIAKGIGHRLPKTITLTFGKRACAALPEQLLPVLGPLLAQIDHLSAGVAEYEARIAVIAARRPEVKPLTSVPGVGTLTALTFTLTLGRASRFERSRDVGSYLGLRPRRRQSGERDPELGISRAGDSYLRKLLVQCAHHILGRFGPDTALRQWGLGKAGGAGATKRAIVAVARKLAVLLHSLWVSGENFKPFPMKG
jgi:transposase